jgi:hypothetical protein
MKLYANSKRIKETEAIAYRKQVNDNSVAFLCIEQENKKKQDKKRQENRRHERNDKRGKPRGGHFTP